MYTPCRHRLSYPFECAYTYLFDVSPPFAYVSRCNDICLFVGLSVCKFVCCLCVACHLHVVCQHTHSHAHTEVTPLSPSYHTSFSHSNNLCTFLMAATQAAPAGFGRITTRFQFVARFNYHVPTQKAALNSHLHTARRHLSAPTALPERRALGATFLSAAFRKPVKSPCPA